jgi:hypothetical protein
VSQRLTFLARHNVEATWCYPAAAGTVVRGLGWQLQWLKRVANVVPLERALGDLNGGGRCPRGRSP